MKQFIFILITLLIFSCGFQQEGDTISGGGTETSGFDKNEEVERTFRPKFEFKNPGTYEKVRILMEGPEDTYALEDVRFYSGENLLSNFFR